MRCSCAVAAALAVSALACGDTAVVVTIDSDRAVPAELDGLCMAVADRNPDGGEFSAFYRLEGELASLPQTLVVEPGGASGGVVSARGYRGGVEVARDRASFDFGGGVDELGLELPSCPEGRGEAPGVVDSVDAGMGARVAVSFGRGGSLVIVVEAGRATVYDAREGRLERLGLDLPDPPTGSALRQIVAFDADGDCDDDLLLLPPDSPPVLWRRRSDASFVEASGAFAGAGLTPLRAAATADVDGDGDLDLVVGGGAVLRLLRNDGTGRFQPEAAAIPADVATDVTALAFGELDGDGHVDLVVGQGETDGAPPRALFNDGAGTGFYELAVAALPEVDLRARAVAIADVAGNDFLDVLIASDGAAVRLYVNRGDGRLEDRSFVELPNTVAVAGRSAALGDWTGDCAVDAFIGRADEPPLLWRGATDGPMSGESFGDAVGEQVVVADIDDDGVLDALVAGTDGVHWVAR